MENWKHTITDAGARNLAMAILKQAVLDWNSEIRKPQNPKPIYKLRLYFRSDDCDIHCAFAAINHEQLNKKLERMRKEQLKLQRMERLEEQRIKKANPKR